MNKGTFECEHSLARLFILPEDGNDVHSLNITEVRFDDVAADPAPVDVFEDSAYTNTNPIGVRSLPTVPLKNLGRRPVRTVDNCGLVTFCHVFGFGNLIDGGVWKICNLRCMCVFWIALFA